MNNLLQIYKLSQSYAFKKFVQQNFSKNLNTYFCQLSYIFTVVLSMYTFSILLTFQLFGGSYLVLAQ